MTLRMCMNACGRHAKATKNQQAIVFGTLSLGNAFIATIHNELH